MPDREITPSDVAKSGRLYLIGSRPLRMHPASPPYARRTGGTAAPEASTSSFAERGEFHLFLTLGV
jgi:hypothetical protein